MPPSFWEDTSDNILLRQYESRGSQMLLLLGRGSASVNLRNAGLRGQQDSRGHTAITAGTGWLRSSPWLDHTVSTHRCVLIYLFREEDECVTQRRQTSAHIKGKGRERDVGSRGVLAEVTAHRMAEATYGVPEEQRM